MAILGELMRAGLIDTSVKRVDAPSLHPFWNAMILQARRLPKKRAGYI